MGYPSTEIVSKRTNAADKLAAEADLILSGAGNWATFRQSLKDYWATVPVTELNEAQLDARLEIKLA